MRPTDANRKPFIQTCISIRHCVHCTEHCRLLIYQREEFPLDVLPSLACVCRAERPRSTQMSQAGLQLAFELGLTLKRGMTINWPCPCLQILRWLSSPLQQQHSGHPERQDTGRGWPVGKNSRGEKMVNAQ